MITLVFLMRLSVELFLLFLLMIFVFMRTYCFLALDFELWLTCLVKLAIGLISLLPRGKIVFNYNFSAKCKSSRKQ